jgi:hypothetical protein
VDIPITYPKPRHPGPASSKVKEFCNANSEMCRARLCWRGSICIGAPLLSAFLPHLGRPPHTFQSFAMPSPLPRPCSHTPLFVYGWRRWPYASSPSSIDHPPLAPIYRSRRWASLSLCIATNFASAYIFSLPSTCRSKAVTRRMVPHPPQQASQVLVAPPPPPSPSIYRSRQWPVAWSFTATSFASACSSGRGRRAPHGGRTLYLRLTPLRGPTTPRRGVGSPSGGGTLRGIFYGS